MLWYSVFSDISIYLDLRVSILTYAKTMVNMLTIKNNKNMLFWNLDFIYIVANHGRLHANTSGQV